MNVSRSFRARLAWRFAATVAALLVLASTVGYFALRTFLYQRLDGTVLRLAQIEAAATADSPDEHVHFHDEVFLSAGPGQEVILTRFAQVWTLEGQPVVRTRNLGDRDLPLPAEVRNAVVQNRTPLLFSFTWETDRYRAVLYPLELVGPMHAPHLLQVAAATAETDQLLRTVLVFLMALVVVGFGAGGGIGWWLAGYAVRPVLEIIRDAETFRVAERGHRISAHAGAVELERLVTVLNQMLSRIDDALESQRRFVADAGHAIKTPLTILRGDIDVTLRRDRPASEYRKVLDQALQDLRDVSALADDLVTLARSDSGALQVANGPVPVTQLLQKLADRFRGAASRAGASIETAGADDLWVVADTVLLERALAGLLDNAVKYAPHGTIRLAAAQRPRERIAISVSDEGPGIPNDERELVFERFYRGTRVPAGAPGTGLGLAMVRAVTHAMGGRVELDSSFQGTTISIMLAQAQAAEVASPTSH